MSTGVVRLTMLFLVTIICATFTLPVKYESSAGTDDRNDGTDQFPLSLGHAELKISNASTLQRDSIIVGQNVVVSSTVSGELGNETDALYIVQAKDEDGIVQFINVSNVHFPGENAILELNTTWVPWQSGVYTIEIFVWKSFGMTGIGQDTVSSAVTPIMEKGGISIPVFVSPSKVVTSGTGPEGISLIIEKIGKREFYQDRKVFLPTDLTITRDESADWQILAWPSIGPNYIISELDEASNTSATVFDYYASLGIDTDMTQVRYDEYLRGKDIGPLPEQSGRYFGFEWNQTGLDGTKAGAGKYQVYLTIPVLIGDIGTGDDKRSRLILRSDPDYFTILEGKPNDLQHDLSLRIVNLTKTALETEEPFSYAVVLVNNGDHPEYLTVDSNSLNIVPASRLASLYQPSCTLAGSGGLAYASYFIHEQPLMPGSQLVIENNSFSAAPNRPGIYNLTGPVVLSIADEPMTGKSEDDGIRASCLDVYIDPITFNVTAAKYDGIRLVLGTDKQVYARNETVSFSLYIENNSSEAFKLRDVSPIMVVRDANGSEIFSAGYIPGLSQLPVVEPHSVYRLDFIPLSWDQKDYYHGPSFNEPIMAKPGVYSIIATFVSPYLESETLTIRILE